VALLYKNQDRYVDAELLDKRTLVGRRKQFKARTSSLSNALVVFK
jgi:hypothetical protein